MAGSAGTTPRRCGAAGRDGGPRRRPLRHPCGGGAARGHGSAGRPGRGVPLHQCVAGGVGGAACLILLLLPPRPRARARCGYQQSQGGSDRRVGAAPAAAASLWSLRVRAATKYARRRPYVTIRFRFCFCLSRPLRLLGLVDRRARARLPPLCLSRAVLDASLVAGSASRTPELNMLSDGCAARPCSWRSSMMEGEGGEGEADSESARGSRTRDGQTYTSTSSAWGRARGPSGGAARTPRRAAPPAAG